jgi:putative sterol carrier protein
VSTANSPSAVVPRDPESFFRDYVRKQFAELGAGLAGTASSGAVVFRVGTRPPISVRLLDGSLDVSEGVPDDTIVQITLDEIDFEPILVRGAELLASQKDATAERQLAVLKALTLDRERIDLIRSVRGSVAFVLSGDGAQHRFVLTPGAATPNLQATECTVRCGLSDFLAMQRGSANPFELMMNGKIQISGDAQIPMALSSLLV